MILNIPYRGNWECGKDNDRTNDEDDANKVLQMIIVNRMLSLVLYSTCF